MTQPMCQFRISKGERSKIDQAAEAAGLTRSEYIRTLLLDDDKKLRPAETAAIMTVLGELKRVGNNVNQIAKKLNEGQQFDDEDTLMQALKVVHHNIIKLNKVVKAAS